MAGTNDPLLLEIPRELKTPRLTLRVPAAGDGQRVYATVRRSLEELKAWMAWATDVYSARDAELWCRRGAAGFLTRQELNYLILLGSQHVGNASLFAINWKIPRCEVGYWLASGQVGQGLMTEAVKGLAELAFGPLSMARVELRNDARNDRSARVAERCGFQLEGVLRSDSLHIDGTLRDTRIYSRIRDPAIDLRSATP